MKFNNERILSEMILGMYKKWGLKGLVEKVDELETRLELLENPIPKKRGRPAKVLNG
jgi:hypothetical protein